MPTPNYSDLTGDILTCNPVFDFHRKIICIDGGNGVKRSGQLNALIRENGMFSTAWADELPQAAVLHAQEASPEPASIAWQHKEIELLAAGNSESLCRCLYTGRTLLIPNEKLFLCNGRQCSYDYTDYWLPLSAGDIVSIVEEGQKKCFVKHNGVLGWCSKESLHFV